MAIILKTISDSKAARDDLSKLRASVENISKSATEAKATFMQLGASAAAFAGLTVTVQSLITQLDKYTNITNKLKIATNSQEGFNKAFQGTKEID